MQVQVQVRVQVLSYVFRGYPPNRDQAISSFGRAQQLRYLPIWRIAQWLMTALHLTYGTLMQPRKTCRLWMSAFIQTMLALEREPIFCRGGNPLQKFRQTSTNSFVAFQKKKCSQTLYLPLHFISVGPMPHWLEPTQERMYLNAVNFRSVDSLNEFT